MAPVGSNCFAPASEAPNAQAELESNVKDKELLLIEIFSNTFLAASSYEMDTL